MPIAVKSTDRLRHQGDGCDSASGAISELLAPGVASVADSMCIGKRDRHDLTFFHCQGPIRGPGKRDRIRFSVAHGLVAGQGDRPVLRALVWPDRFQVHPGNLSGLGRTIRKTIPL